MEVHKDSLPQLDPEHCSVTVMDSSRWWSRFILDRKSGCKRTLVASWHCVYVGNLHMSYKVWPDSMNLAWVLENVLSFFSLPLFSLSLFFFSFPPSLVMFPSVSVLSRRQTFFLWDGLLRSIQGLMILPGPERGLLQVKIAFYCISAGARAQSLWHSMRLKV